MTRACRITVGAAATLLLSGCLSFRADRIDPDRDVRAALQIEIPTVGIRDALACDVVGYLGWSVNEKYETLSLSAMPDAATIDLTMTLQTNNVTVGQVLRELLQQTGLVSDILAGALFVGSPTNLARIKSIPMLPPSPDSVLEQKLNQRVGKFHTAYMGLPAISAFVMRESGIPIVVDDGLRDDSTFVAGTEVKMMTWRHFIWWMSVLTTDGKPTLDGRTIRIMKQQSSTNHVDGTR